MGKSDEVIQSQNEESSESAVSEAAIVASGVDVLRRDVSQFTFQHRSQVPPSPPPTELYFSE